MRLISKAILKSLLEKTVWKLSPFLFISLNYFRSRGNFPNLKNPKNLSEIILSTIYSGKVNEYSDFADKIKVREYYKKWGYENYLPQIHGIWNNTDEINFDEFPEAFALKTNHGCGHHYICKDKKQLNIKEAKNVIDEALSTKYGITETQYHAIKPLIYCEEYIDDGTGSLPVDYKFMCVDGEIKSILIVTERTALDFKLVTFNTRWEKLDYVSAKYKTKKIISAPKNLNTMISIAKKISLNFEFVRVDFFDVGDKLFIGELTFTPWGGNVAYYTSEAIKEMGR
jgi:hypothetical protein